MKKIEIDDDLYAYIASNTQFIGESASDILRRLLAVNAKDTPNLASKESVEQSAKTNVSNDKKVVNKESIFDLVNKEELAMLRSAVGRFLAILGALYRVHNKEFAAVLEIRGRDRLYFATSEQDILECGSSTKPRQIPGSPYWVITNSNTTRKKLMLTEVAYALGYNEECVESIRDLLV